MKEAVWGNITFEYLLKEKKYSKEIIMLLTTKNQYLVIEPHRKEFSDLFIDGELLKHSRIIGVFTEVRVGTNDGDYVEIWFECLENKIAVLRDLKANQLLEHNTE